MDSKLIWEAHWSQQLDKIKQAQEDRTIKGVDCFCEDCNFWMPGNKCTAGNIELSYTNVDGRCICECNTYEPTEKVEC